MRYGIDAATKTFEPSLGSARERGVDRGRKYGANERGTHLRAQLEATKLFEVWRL